MANRCSETVRLKRNAPEKPVAVAVIVAVFALGVAAFDQTSDRARTEALARRATERLQTLQREADRLASEEKTLLGELRALEIQRELKSEELRQLNGEVAGVERELASAAERINSLQQQELAAWPQLRARLAELYKLGRARYARLLLSTSDMRRIGQASRTIAALAQLDRDRLASHQRTLAELRSARATLEARRRHMDSLRDRALTARTAADRAAQTRRDFIRDIDRRRDLNAQFLGELQAAQQKLQVTLRDIANGANGATEAAVLPLKPFRGDLDWPVAGPLRRRSPRLADGRPVSSHGVEISAAEGAPALAIHDGLVAFADYFAGFGNLVILDHGSQTFTLYGDLLDIAVKKGGRVEHGQPVGSVGTPPTGGGPGLYFDLRIDGQPVDPLQWLRKR